MKGRRRRDTHHVAHVPGLRHREARKTVVVPSIPCTPRRINMVSATGIWKRRSEGRLLVDLDGHLYGVWLICLSTVNQERKAMSRQETNSLWSTNDDATA